MNVGHFLLGVSCAYDLLYEVLPDADRAAIAIRLGTEADRMYQAWANAWYVDQYPQNHNWINAAGMGLAGLALQGEDARAGNWLSRAQDDLAKVNLVLGEIVYFHVRDGIYDAATGRLDMHRLRPVGRLCGNLYTHVHDIFEMKRPGTTYRG